MSAAERRSICDQAQGNPLAPLELPPVWAHSPGIVDGPRALSTRLERAFAGRIVEFPTVTKDALLLAATDSSSDLVEVLSAASAFTGSTCDGSVFGPAEATGLVSTAGGLMRFRHPLVRSGVLQQETVARRQRAHRALAQVLPESETFRRAWASGAVYHRAG